MGLLARISLASVNLRLPDKSSGQAIQAEHGLRLLRPVGGGEINALAYNRGRTMAAPWQRCLPKNIFRLTPLCWWILPRSRDAVACRAAPAWPVRCGIYPGCCRERRLSETETYESYCCEVRSLVHDGQAESLSNTQGTGKLVEQNSPLRR